jgi:hypothetical protein
MQLRRTREDGQARDLSTIAPSSKSTGLRTTSFGCRNLPIWAGVSIAGPISLHPQAHPQRAHQLARGLLRTACQLRMGGAAIAAQKQEFAVNER